MISVVRATPTFGRAVKKLHARDKKAVDDAVREIMKVPKIGERRVIWLECECINSS